MVKERNFAVQKQVQARLCEWRGQAPTVFSWQNFWHNMVVFSVLWLVPTGVLSEYSWCQHTVIVVPRVWALRQCGCQGQYVPADLRLSHI